MRNKKRGRPELRQLEACAAAAPVSHCSLDSHPSGGCHTFSPFHHLFIRILSSARHHLFVIILRGRNHQGLRAGAVHLICHPPEGHHHLRIFLHSLYIFIFSVTTIPPI